LRAAADLEAGRLRDVKAQFPGSQRTSLPGRVPVCIVRARCRAQGSKASKGARAWPLNGRAAIFFARTRIVDGSGRLVEDLMVAVRVCSDIEGPAQQVLDRCHARVRAVCLREVAARIGDLARLYRDGFTRVRMRETWIAEDVHVRRNVLVQPGLFEQRALHNRVPAVEPHRQQSLIAASSLLLAQPPEILLLLMTRGT
jgi:hypothetical protein